MAVLVAASLAIHSPPAIASTESLVPAEIGPLVSGTVAYVDGVHTWTDYAYDDLSTAYRNGERNAADLIQLQVTVEDGEVIITAVLQTLVDPSVPAVTVELDTDLDGVSDHTLTGGDVDTASNTVRLRLAEDPGRAVWNITASVATASDGVVHDLAYVGDELPEGWQDARQQAVLTGSEARPWGTVDFGLIADRATIEPDLTEPGWHTLLYRSGLSLGEGIGSSTITTVDGRSVPSGDLYAGPYQPYLVWVPEHLPTSPPLVVHMHGLGGTHTSTYGLIGPGLVDPAAVVVSPLGRGGTTFFMGAAEQDVLDVIDDSLARFGADPDRVVLSGTSMGGFGTFRLAVLRPDRFSVALPLIGTGASAQSAFPGVPAAVSNEVFPPGRFPGGQAELLANLWNLPLRAVNGQADPIVNNVLSTEDLALLTNLGSDHRFWVLLRRHHEVVPQVTACLFDQATKAVRATAPARVRYVVEPATWIDDPATGLHLRYDQAYWISRLVASGDLGSVDATSLARADRTLVGERVDGIGDNIVAGADLCGPNPAVRTNDSWREHGVVQRPGPPQPVSNGLQITLEGLDTATVDLPRAGLITSAPLTVHVTSDQGSALRLTGSWTHSVVATVEGGTAQLLDPEDGALVLPVTQGRATWTIQP